MIAATALVDGGVKFSERCYIGGCREKSEKGGPSIYSCQHSTVREAKWKQVGCFKVAWPTMCNWIIEVLCDKDNGDFRAPMQP